MNSVEDVTGIFWELVQSILQYAYKDVCTFPCYKQIYESMEHERCYLVRWYIVFPRDHTHLPDAECSRLEGWSHQDVYFAEEGLYFDNINALFYGMLSCLRFLADPRARLIDACLKRMQSTSQVLDVADVLAGMTL